MRTIIFALAVGLLPFAGGSVHAQDDIDLTGMDCAEMALHLRDIVEANEPQDEEANRLNNDITSAQAECRNGDDSAFMDLAQDFEGRMWQADTDRLETR